MPVSIDLLSRAAGDLQQWPWLVGAATQWEAVQNNDGDTSYSGCNWPNDDVTSLFRFDALPAGVVGVISNVTIHIIMKRTNASLAQYRICWKLGASFGQTGFSTFSNTNYVDKTGSFNTSPFTGLPWTETEVNNLQAGANLWSNFWATIATQVKLNVTYVPLCQVTTDPATSVGATAALLNGTLVTSQGEAAVCGFEWGPTIAYGNTTPMEAKTDGQAFQQKITGLDLFNTYHFRAKGTTIAGNGVGADQTFTTLRKSPGNAYVFSGRNI